jgi:hypothetical protein
MFLLGSYRGKQMTLFHVYIVLIPYVMVLKIIWFKWVSIDEYEKK